ncbi:MAG: sigma-70 family RNA polymerase sigma factor [Planctomycetes bacterium]|nr:sigma-70 family RNA polymerase sigma factor [Planctomycetota bacterium]
MLVAHDARGLERVLADHGARVSSLLRREFRGVLDALQVDDAISQALQRVWRAASSFDFARGSLAAWFTVIARNCARRIRDQARRGTTESLASVEGAVAPRAAEAGEGPSRWLAVFRQCIDELQPQQRAVLLADLAAGGTVPAGELAVRLGTTANSVYVSRANGRKALRIALQQRERQSQEKHRSEDA